MAMGGLRAARSKQVRLSAPDRDLHRIYNSVRPHASLGFRPPAPEVFVPALAAWPAALRGSVPGRGGISRPRSGVAGTGLVGWRRPSGRPGKLALRHPTPPAEEPR